MIQGKRIVLGVTGSIAAFKAVQLVRELKNLGAEVTVVMTRSARKFVTPLTFEVLSGKFVHTDLFSPSREMAHVTVGEQADLVLVAPATADFMARVASGFASDLLTAIVLTTKAPLIFAPAMDGEMWHKSVTRKNAAFLQEEGVLFIGPDAGMLASGRSGVGRLAETGAIVRAVEDHFQTEAELRGKRVCVTAGPTREPIDPVRVLSNRSSGKMGYALAEEAIRRGAGVELITGPVDLVPPAGVVTTRVETGREMMREVKSRFDSCDILIMAAAVSDYRLDPFPGKIKKEGKDLILKLVPADDILAEMGKRKKNQFLVGFAAETDPDDRYPLEKLKNKNLDLVVANNIMLPGSGFGSDTNRVILFDRDGTREPLPLLPKKVVARRIFDKIIALMNRDHPPIDFPKKRKRRGPGPAAASRTGIEKSET